MATKKMNVPDLGNLLGKITEKRESGELPKTEIQRVQPVDTAKRSAGQPEQSVTLSAEPENKPVVGRPSTKVDGVEYVKISPRIPKALKKSADFSMVEERFKDKNGRSVTTMDELVALALERILEESRK